MNFIQQAEEVPPLPPPLMEETPPVPPLMEETPPPPLMDLLLPQECKRESESSPTKNKHTRRSLSLGEKLLIIEEIEGGKNKNRLADERKIARSTIFSIWDSRHKIKSANAVHGRHGGCKRLRPSEYDEVDQALYRWYLHARDKGMSVSSTVLVEKAKSFSNSLGVQFKNTGSWMDRFKSRHGIKIRKSGGNSSGGADDDDGCGAFETEDPRECRDEFVRGLPSITMGKHYQDIYCVNEIGLLYHVLPDENQIICGTSNVGSNKRVTILLGTNMDGTDLLPPLVIGNSQALSSFENTESLSVSYAYNKSSLMTVQIWRDWIKAFDRRMQLMNRQVILFSDGSPSNYNIAIQDLKAVTVKFVPARSTAFMPTKQGIMRRFKMWYRKLVLRDMVESMNDGVVFHVDLLGGLHFIRKAWERVTQDCVLNAFKVAGWSWDEGYADSVHYSEPSPSIASECYKLNISESIFNEIDKEEECMKTQEELTDQNIIDSVASQHGLYLESINEVNEMIASQVKNIGNDNNISNSNGCSESLLSENGKPDLAQAKNAMKTIQAFLETCEQVSNSKPKKSEPRKKQGRPKKKVVEKGKVMSLNPEKGVFEMTMTKIVKNEGEDDEMGLDMDC